MQVIHWHEHTVSWITAQDAKPSMMKNTWNMRDMKRWKICTRRSLSPRDKRRHPNYPDQISPRGHKEQNAAQCLSSSPARECKLVHFLNLSGSSWLCFWASLCSVRWTVIPFFSYNVCNAMVLMLTILSYVSFGPYISTLTLLKWKTLNKSFNYKKFLFHMLSFAHGWVIWIA